MVFCFAPKLIAILLALLAMIVVVGYVKKYFTFTFYRPHVWLVLLYVAYIIGMLYTNHPDIAGGYAENKLSFFVFPLLFSFKPTFKLRTNELLIGLVIGTTIASLMGIAHGIQLYQAGNSFLGSFTTSFISPIHHPSYFAMLLLIAAVGSIWAFRDMAKWFNSAWLIPYCIIAFIMFTLCMSLAGFLFLFVLVTYFILRWIYHRFGKLLFYIVLVLSPLVLFFTLSNLPGIKTDFQNTKKAVVTYVKDPVEFIRLKDGSISGNESRLVMWTVAVQVIVKHPLGVGTGNVDDYLTQSLEKYGLHELAEKKYNPHNQFFQTALEIGVFGLLMLLLFLISSLNIAWKTGNKLLLLVIATLIFNALFESMLQRQTGIVFYSFWICFLVLVSSTNHQTRKP